MLSVDNFINAPAELAVVAVGQVTETDILPSLKLNQLDASYLR